MRISDWSSDVCSSDLAHYGQAPRALFITHVHMDHVAGFERLFVADYFDAARRGTTPLYVPATVLPLLHRRVGDYPNVLAHGGPNFWAAFQLFHAGDAFCPERVRPERFTLRPPWQENPH